ncbi:hypothetical protein F4703DRAFT_1866333 [Phycomyces blakesleeanus]
MLALSHVSSFYMVNVFGFFQLHSSSMNEKIVFNLSCCFVLHGNLIVLIQCAFSFLYIIIT